MYAEGTQQVQLITQTMIQGLIIISFLAIVANRLVEAIFAPIFERVKALAPHKFWLMYVAWGVAGGLVWLSGVNVFETFIPVPIAGQVLTALVAGGGANFIHDLFDHLVGLQETYKTAIEQLK